jgi:thiamine biosynthesis lipoprotein
MLRHAFRAMGTEVELLLDATPSAAAGVALAGAEAEVRRLERLLSRFDPESELSRLNRRGEAHVGPELLELVAMALDARRRTGGRFDPTILPALLAAGYDRSFDELQPDGAPPASGRSSARAHVLVDDAAGAIRLAAGAALDLGGIAKGWTADRVADRLAPLGPALANVGGDLAVAGAPLVGGWPVGVAGAVGELTLALERGGLATSGRDHRHWRRGGRDQHHLIDPAAGRPVAGDLERVTVAAATAAEAEVQATSLFVAGAAAALRLAQRHGQPCVLVTRDGRTLCGGGLAA